MRAALFILIAGTGHDDFPAVGPTGRGFHGPGFPFVPQGQGSPLVRGRGIPLVLNRLEWTQFARWRQPLKPLLMRTWRTQIDDSRALDYENFARNVSLPMFRRHDGFLGVFLAGTGCQRAVVTLWASRAAAASLEASADYQATVNAIEAAGFLRPPQRTELLDVHDSWTEPLGDGAI
jgi:heme-degrading monooxygenase HmoA